MNIAFVAHTNKRKLMEDLCIAYKNIFARHSLVATEATARHIEQAAGLSVSRLSSGSLGGIEQLSAQVMMDRVDLLIYLRDTQSPKPYEMEVFELFRLCDMHNVPLATNLATAEALILALDRGDLDWRNIIDR